MISAAVRIIFGIALIIGAIIYTESSNSRFAQILEIPLEIMETVANWLITLF